MYITGIFIAKYSRTDFSVKRRKYDLLNTYNNKKVVEIKINSKLFNVKSQRTHPNKCSPLRWCGGGGGLFVAGSRCHHTIETNMSLTYLCECIS